VEAARVSGVIVGDGPIDLRARRIVEAWRQHARNVIRERIEHDRASDDAGIAAEASLPEAVAQDDGVLAGPVESVGPDPAVNGLDAEQRKEICRADDGRRVLGPRAAADVVLRRIVRRDVREHRRVALEIAHFAHRQPTVLAAHARVDDDEAVRGIEGQRPQHQRRHEAEDGRRPCHGHGDRRHEDEADEGTRGVPAQRQRQVGPEIGQQAEDGDPAGHVGNDASGVRGWLAREFR